MCVCSFAGTLSISASTINTRWNSSCYVIVNYVMLASISDYVTALITLRSAISGPRYKANPTANPLTLIMTTDSRVWFIRGRGFGVI